MTNIHQGPFFGWRVVAGAFVIASLGWGIGFYGTPVYLHTVTKTHDWPVWFVSIAVTLHFVCGAFVVANLPKLYQRFGLKRVTRCGTVLLAIGLIGWATAANQWQLLAAAALTGIGWVTLGAAAINAIISPWFIKDRPKALSMAYNGASFGGILFSPLWVLLIEGLGFTLAAAIVGLLAVVVVWSLTAFVITKQPEDLNQFPDGATAPPEPVNRPNSGTEVASLWSRQSFATLAGGMSLGLFAQIGLLAHLFSILVPSIGTSMAGVLAGMATASAIVGRTSFGWLLGPTFDRRIAASLSYAIQIAGIAVLMVGHENSPALVVMGMLLFGFGLGNATSLPPLIAQVEFDKAEIARAIALVIATAQFTYAFAPAAFGLLREWTGGGTVVFGVAIALKLAAAGSYLAGRRN